MADSARHGGGMTRRGWHSCRCPGTFPPSVVHVPSIAFLPALSKPPPAPSGLPRPGKAPSPCRPLRGPRGHRFLRSCRRHPARGGGRRRRTWDVGVGSLLVGQPIPAAHRRLRAPALHQEGSGHGEGRGHGWARSGAAASAPPPARSPTGRGRCAAVRGAGPHATGRAAEARGGEGEGRRGERVGGEESFIRWNRKMHQETWEGACVLQT